MNNREREDKKGGCGALQRWRDWDEIGTSLDQASVIKDGLSRVRVERIFSVPALAFSTASLPVAVPGCWLHTVSFAKLLWLESEEIPPVGNTLPWTGGVQAPGTVTVEWGTGCGTRAPTLSFPPDWALEKLLSQPEPERLLSMQSLSCTWVRRVAWYAGFVSVTILNRLFLYAGY